MDPSIKSYHNQDPTSQMPSGPTPQRPPPPQVASPFTNPVPHANPPPVYSYQSQTPSYQNQIPQNLENQSRYDAENDSYNTFSDTNVRLGFVRKVYGILAIQLLITFGFVLIFQLSDGSRVWASNNQGWIYVAFIFGFGSLITLACCEGFRRAFPVNFICLGIFTLCQSFMLGMVTAFYDTSAVTIAILMTMVVVIGISIFSFQTKYDFTVYNLFAFVAGLIFLSFGIITIFLHSVVLQVLYSAIGTLLFSFYLIIDTQMIIGGQHKNNISPEEYIFAAITLYTDILNIFLFILDLVQRAK